MKYYSNDEATIASNAKIGEIEFNKENFNFAFTEKTGEAIFSSFLISLLGLFVLALVMNALFPKFTFGATNIAYQQSGKSALIGFAYIVLAPIAIVLLMITLVGIPSALAFTSIYIASFFISGALAVILTGKLLMNLFRRGSENITWITMLVGSLAYVLIGLIPVFGWFVKFALVIIAMGAFIQSLMPKNQQKIEQPKSNNIKLANSKSPKNNVRSKSKK